MAINSLYCSSCWPVNFSYHDRAIDYILATDTAVNHNMPVLMYSLFLYYSYMTICGLLMAQSVPIIVLWISKIVLKRGDD